LIRNLSNSSGQKSAKNSGEENPGIIYTSVAAKKTYRVCWQKELTLATGQAGENRAGRQAGRQAAFN
jgi:hypothetical protein